MGIEQRDALATEPTAGEKVEEGAVRARRPESNGAGEKPEAGEPHGPPHSVLREYFESLVVTAIMAIFGMTFIVQAVKVPTGSMQNTILIGDHLLVNKFIFAPGPIMPFLPQREIRRGDIIVFKYPGKSTLPQFEKYDINDDDPNNTPFKINYVKRVIGLPGDRVEIKGTEVFVNGQLLPEQRIGALNPPQYDDGDDLNGDEKGAPLRDERDIPLTGESAPPRAAGYTVYWRPETLAGGEPFHEGENLFEVPPGQYLVMGDNRENSQDGRYWGYVPRELVIGRAMFVYWSFDESLPRSDMMIPFNFISDFINNTRWSRTGTLVR
jgi:signal peptidase I